MSPTMSIILIVVFVIVIIAVIVIAINVAMKKEKQIYQEGIEVDSVVSRSESYFDRDHDMRYRCFVKYVGDDNLEHEAILNVHTNLPVGRKVKIRFLPGKYDEAVFVSQELE